MINLYSRCWTENYIEGFARNIKCERCGKDARWTLHGKSKTLHDTWTICNKCCEMFHKEYKRSIPAFLGDAG